MAVAGLLLAAGAGRRFGRPKALVPFAGRPLVDRGVGLLAAGGCHPVHVVLGAAADRVVATADLAGALPVPNPDWATGMASSLRAGLASFGADPAAVVVALVDQPLVGAESVRRLRAAHRAGARAAVATYHGRPRNPVLLDRAVWPDVLAAAHGDSGARGYLRGNPDVTAVDCTGTGDPADIDTPADLARLEDLAPDGRSARSSRYT